MKKICVYTCITGDYDKLNEIEKVEKEIDYYCFTNNKLLSSSTWTIIYIENDKLTNTQLARKIKILGHPTINNKYDIMLWMDGSIIFKRKITDFIKYYLKNEDMLVVFKHSIRTNIKEEAEACLNLKKETKNNIEKILNFYAKEKYPFNNGLIESGVFIRRTKQKLVDQTMNLWYQMIEEYTTRDQLSFNYCIYKTNLPVKWINEKISNNDWLYCREHKIDLKSYIVNFYDEKNESIYTKENYIIKNNKYLIDIKVPKDCTYCTIELSKVSCIILNKLKAKEEILNNIEYYNYIDYENNKKLFYNDNGIIKVNIPFKKNDKLSIELDLKILETDLVYDFFEKVCINNINLKGEINILKNNIIRLEEEKRKIIESKGWKMLQKLRSFKRH